MSAAPGSPSTPAGAPPNRFGQMVNGIEEGLIALLLGAMTALTFANVIARYLFSSNILWANEATVFLFAWLVLIGCSHLVKTSSHLGVDALVHALPPASRKAMALIAGCACLAYGILLLIGAWQYWLPFVGKQVWYETQDIPMIDLLRFIEPLMNENEAYEKLPRFIPYVILPLSMTLLLFRFLEVMWKIWKGEVELMVASHEVEDAIEDAKQDPGQDSPSTPDKQEK
ncbi:MAG: TRAP transporter small permease [Rhodospirillaceae bacterium]